MGNKKRKIFFESVLKNKKAVGIEELKGWIIALILMVIMFGGYMIFSGKMSGAIEYVQNLFRFRG